MVRYVRVTYGTSGIRDFDNMNDAKIFASDMASKNYHNIKISKIKAKNVPYKTKEILGRMRF